MSSKIVAVYSRLIEVLAELYPNKTRIPYAYDIERNNQRFLIDGYALAVQDAVFEEIDFCGFNVVRDIDVIFTRSLHKMDSSVDEIDELIKSMLQDVYLVQKSFYNYNELDIPESIERVRINSVSAPEEVIGENSKYLQMSASFSFDINEKL